MAQFPTSNLSLSTIAGRLGRTLPESINDLRGATVWDTNFTQLTVPALPTSLSLSYFFGKYYTNPRIDPINVIYSLTTTERNVSVPITSRNPTSYTITLIGFGGGGGGGGGGTYSVNNNASGGGGGGGAAGAKITRSYTFIENKEPSIYVSVFTDPNEVLIGALGGPGGRGSGQGDLGAASMDGANGGGGLTVLAKVFISNEQSEIIRAEGGLGGRGGGRGIYQSVFNGIPGYGGAGGSGPGNPGGNGLSGSNSGRSNNDGGGGGLGGTGPLVIPNSPLNDNTGGGGSGGKGGNTRSGVYDAGASGSRGQLGRVDITWYYNGWLQ